MSGAIEKNDGEISDSEDVVENTFEDWAEQEEAEKVQSLFSATIFDSVQDLIAHDLEVFGFDLKEAVRNVESDVQSVIMLVNFIRSKVLATDASCIDSEFINRLKTDLSGKQYLEDSNNMVPVLPEDPLLYLLNEVLAGSEDLDNCDEDEYQPASSEQIETTKKELREALPNYNDIVTSLS